ncbi:hypothetical protein EJB05_49922, partial [Eragrostis curvula]
MTGDSHVVDIAPSRQLRNVMDVADSSATQLVTGCPTIIGKVSNKSRDVLPTAYSPQHVSIGPYHRTWHTNLARDDEKNEYLHAILPAESTVEVCLNELARLEDQARRCYSHTVKMNSSQFVRSLLLDGCYLLACFNDNDDDDDGSRSGAPVANGHVPQADHHGGDMLEDVAVVSDAFFLAENQIPFFVIDKIHQLTAGGAPTAIPVVRYAQKLLEGRKYSVAKPAVGGASGPANLLHLLHMHLTPTVLILPPTGGPDTDKPVGRWRQATQYNDIAGIKFKRRPLSADGARCILDVKLDSGAGTLEIPMLHIEAETWRFLRNLMALEHHNPEAAGKHVTAYCILMSQVACTEADVELLSRKGVIEHSLGSHKDAAVFFADLCKGIMFDPNGPGSNYLRATNQELEKRFQSRQQRWMAWLVRNYFSNPWVTVGLMLGAIGLACEVVQAVFSVLSYGNHLPLLIEDRVIGDNNGLQADLRTIYVRP